MRILLVNTSEKTGGAAVACNRLMEALNNSGVKAKMLVRDKETDSITVAALEHQWLQQWRFIWERLVIFVHSRFSKKHLFEIDIANTGADITQMQEFKDADVVHLHWINQGMLSLSDIAKILKSGKPVVWTMHDLWPATALCHYVRGCTQFTVQCNNCPLIPGSLASSVWRRKTCMLRNNTIHFVTCSRWLMNEAKKSALISGMPICSIPNAIDTHVFHPTDKKAAREANELPVNKRIILFVSQKVTDKRKGMDYFISAIDILVKKYPETKEDTAIAILGGHSEDVTESLSLPAFPLGYISNPQQIVSVYNTATVFVLPSLEDNLPNTIMESMACGVPCVGFKVGGIPEMIDHKKNGYVAEFKNADDLAEGIHWVLERNVPEDGENALDKEAVTKVHRCYSQNTVAMKYINVYDEALAHKHYNL